MPGVSIGLDEALDPTAPVTCGCSAGTPRREMEDAVLRAIARLDGPPFPSAARLASGWLRGRDHSQVYPVCVEFRGGRR